MAGQETTSSGKNTLYHGTMIDLTDALDETIDLTEEAEEPKDNSPKQSTPQKQQNQTPLLNPPRITLNHKLQVYSSASSSQPVQPPPKTKKNQLLPSTSGQSPQAKPILTSQATPFRAALPLATESPKPTQAKSIKPLNKSVQPVVTKQLDASQAKPNQSFQKQPSVQPSVIRKSVDASQAAALISKPCKEARNKVLKTIDLTECVDEAEAQISKKSNPEIVRKQLAALRKTQDELLRRDTTAPHSTLPFENSPRTEVSSTFNLEQSEAITESQSQLAVSQAETNTQTTPTGGIQHVPVLAPCLDTSGQYVLLPAAMLRQLMVPVAMAQKSGNSVTQSFFMMPNINTAESTVQPIVVQNVENQSNYIKSVVNTVPTVPSNSQKSVAIQKKEFSKSILKLPSLAARPRPVPKTGKNLPMNILSDVIQTKMDAPNRASETELSSFPNVDSGKNGAQTESSFIDLTENDADQDQKDDIMKHQEEEVIAEPLNFIDLGEDVDEDVTAEDPLDESVHLPETVVVDTVTPIDIGTILKQPIQAAPTDEWCFESELPIDCLKYTMRSGGFIGFPRLEWERKPVCQNIINDLYSENLRSLLKHQKVMRDLDMAARKLRERQFISTYVTEARGQFKKPDYNVHRRPSPRRTPVLPPKRKTFLQPKETPFLPPKTTNFLPSRERGNNDHVLDDEESSDENESVTESSVEEFTKMKRGRPLGSKTTPRMQPSPTFRIGKRNAPIKGKTDQFVDSAKIVFRKKYVYAKKKVTTAVKKKDEKVVVPKDVPSTSTGSQTKRYRKIGKSAKKSKRPPARPPIEVMTDADNPNEDDNDLFVVKKVQILNKDHNVVVMRYNPNCI